MKRVILLLILANLVLYLWRTNNAAPDKNTAPPPSAEEVDQLVLLAEQGSAREQQKSQEQKSPATTPAASGGAEGEKKDSQDPGTVPKPVCYTLGPWIKEDDTSQLRAELALAGVRSGVRKKSVAPVDGYRYLVFLPTSERENAKKIVGELTAKGVKDFYIADKNFVALGVFSIKQLAMDRAEELRKLGYTTAIKEEGTARTEYWFDTVQDNPSAPTLEQRRSMLSAYPHARQATKDCGDIVLPETTP